MIEDPTQRFEFAEFIGNVQLLHKNLFEAVTSREAVDGTTIMQIEDYLDRATVGEIRTFMDDRQEPAFSTIMATPWHFLGGGPNNLPEKPDGPIGVNVVELQFFTSAMERIHFNWITVVEETEGIDSTPQHMLTLWSHDRTIEDVKRILTNRAQLIDRVLQGFRFFVGRDPALP